MLARVDVAMSWFRSMPRSASHIERFTVGNSSFVLELLQSDRRIHMGVSGIAAFDSVGFAAVVRHLLR
jgi:hypothetical protein